MEKANISIHDRSADSVFQDALASTYLILSVMGAQAGETVEQIFKRKIGDIQRSPEHQTIWYHASSHATPTDVQNLVDLGARHVVFIEPASRAVDFRNEEDRTNPYVCREYSADERNWDDLPYARGLSNVTASSKKTTRYGLVFGSLYGPVEIGRLNLWDYARHPALKPLKLMIGTSTVCATRFDVSRAPDRIKSNMRRVIGIGELAAPYEVWLR